MQIALHQLSHLMLFSPEQGMPLEIHPPSYQQGVNVTHLNDSGHRKPPQHKLIPDVPPHCTHSSSLRHTMAQLSGRRCIIGSPCCLRRMQVRRPEASKSRGRDGKVFSSSEVQQQVGFTASQSCLILMIWSCPFSCECQLRILICLPAFKPAGS